ncbi:hypothetical protein FA15DRAFT_655144 [Coprinopsis marcescibilis]|uniref:Uncharacterized protein n=1 Tax=Coprinopsis marcescibilis TaxID=230819 RepID=A0A5C3KYU9_COPMA|nr:hypothetical protein FA15DRAFT_655144 [Coprinopsis marcescibilis]
MEGFERSGFFVNLNEAGLCSLREDIRNSTVATYQAPKCHDFVRRQQSYSLPGLILRPSITDLSFDSPAVHPPPEYTRARSTFPNATSAAVTSNENAPPYSPSADSAQVASHPEKPPCEVETRPLVTNPEALNAHWNAAEDGHGEEEGVFRRPPKAKPLTVRNSDPSPTWNMDDDGGEVTRPSQINRTVSAFRRGCSGLISTFTRKDREECVQAAQPFGPGQLLVTSCSSPSLSPPGPGLTPTVPSSLMPGPILASSNAGPPAIQPLPTISEAPLVVNPAAGPPLVAPSFPGAVFPFAGQPGPSGDPTLIRPPTTSSSGVNGTVVHHADVLLT